MTMNKFVVLYKVSHMTTTTTTTTVLRILIFRSLEKKSKIKNILFCWGYLTFLCDCILLLVCFEICLSTDIFLNFNSV